MRYLLIFLLFFPIPALCFPEDCWEKYRSSLSPCAEKCQKERLLCDKKMATAFALPCMNEYLKCKNGCHLKYINCREKARKHKIK